MIEKKLHFIWVGDESKRPDNCINTWAQHHPGWEIKIWGNRELLATQWINARHIQQMFGQELNGVADLMRWEILYQHGGIVLDADSICVRPLPEWILESDVFACWESELERPMLIAAGYVGAVAKNPFIGQIIHDLHQKPTVTNDKAWRTVGPMALTEAYYKYKYSSLTILPSHFFIPEHYSGRRYEGAGPVFALQEWGSTRRSYDKLHLKTVA
jgi:mannosyltransferase OCH1-like enzyme